MGTRANIVGGAVLCAAMSATAQDNLLINPGFEMGLDGWVTFGNVFHETSRPPRFEPFEGDGLASMFGPFVGGFGVSGLFQSFEADPGSKWMLDVYTRHWMGDALTGAGAPDANSVVMKIVFRDRIGDEIGAVEATILDGTFPTDTWIDNDPIIGEAPAGTVVVESFFLFLQPGSDGGACHLDAAFFGEAVDGCYADCDASGTLDFFDFLCFQNAFATGDPYADCDGTGSLDFFDFLCFQNEFGLGCP